MATVVITCFLFTTICFYKMDADIEKTPRDLLSRREKRWSMNSQRLEQILAELMKPISDIRRSFDTDLSALLEEYLTEAGLHALAAAEDEDDEPLSMQAGAGAGGGAGAASAAHTNFVELAMLLQQSASIYGRKVDFLYQHVLAVSDSLHNNTQEESSPGGPGGPGGGVEEVATPARRRRRASGALGGDFGPLELEAAPGARREEGPPRPPPTLPRLYIDLEPSVPTHRDLRLKDQDQVAIGLLTDYHVTWSLQDGLLVDVLDEGCGGGGGKRSLRAIPLAELQAAIAAAAPAPLPPLPHCHSPPPPPASPLPPLLDPPACSTPLPPTPAAQDKLQRKRKSEAKVEEIFEGSLKFSISKAGLRKLRKVEEFSLPAAWGAGVVRARRDHVRRARVRLREARPHDYYAFSGWSLGAGRAARTVALRARQAVLAMLRSPSTSTGDDPHDSEDDGFFELSDLADSEELSHNDTNELACSGAVSAGALAACTGACAWASWSEGVAARATAAEALGGVDVRALAERVLAAAPNAPSAHDAPEPFDDILRKAAHSQNDVSRLFLASLFLANSGNVELVGSGGVLGGVALRVLSRDATLYAGAADTALAPPSPHTALDTPAR